MTFRVPSIPLTTKAVEGQPRPGPYYLQHSGGWLMGGSNLNWWQLGESLVGADNSALVEACVSAYSQTIAMLPGDHWKLQEDGGRTRVDTSALSRILRKPNAYQSISDFLLNSVRSLYLEGNAYALALRNSRYEIVELHPMNARSSWPQIAVTGEIFYNLSGNEVIDRMLPGPLIVPQRDVLHIRLHTERNILVGVSPLQAVAMDIAAGNAMARQQLNFYLNQARPSTVLVTDLILDKDQAEAVRQRWDEQSRGLNQGGTPILTAGLKPHNMSVSAKDSELADMMKLSEQRIALAYRIPLQILGIGGIPNASTEALMQTWLASGLGFPLNHIEEAFGLLFGLYGQPWEYMELNTAVLLRSAKKDQIETLVRGVQGGIYSPNEARNDQELPKVKSGDEPRVQQQVVPLSAAEAIPGAPPAPGAPATPAIPAAANDDGDEENEERGEREKRLRGIFRASHAHVIR